MAFIGFPPRSVYVPYAETVASHGSVTAARAAGALPPIGRPGFFATPVGEFLTGTWTALVFGMLGAGFVGLLPRAARVIVHAAAVSHIVKRVSEGRLPSPYAVGLLFPPTVKFAGSFPAPSPTRGVPETGAAVYDFGKYLWRVFAPGPAGPGTGGGG